MGSDHYAVLGVAHTASGDEIRQAYIGLARKYHPDRHHGAARADAEVRMQSINEAWSTLSDESRRRQYDAKSVGSQPRPKAAASGRTKRGRNHWKPVDAEPLSEADLDPAPIQGSRGLPKWMTMAPLVGVVIAFVVLGSGMLVDSKGLLTIGLLVLALACVAFVAIPLVALSRAQRDPKM